MLPRLLGFLRSLWPAPRAGGHPAAAPASVTAGGTAAVAIGGDANQALIVTGSNNRTFVFYGADRLTPEQLAAIRADPEAEGAIPLPLLTLAVGWTLERKNRLAIETRRYDPEHPETLLIESRQAAAPWADTPRFRAALEEFWELSRRALESESERTRLSAAARDLGEALAALLTPAERALLIEASRWDPPPPLLVIESDAELILALPWELLWLDGAYAVEAGRLDVARSIAVPKAPVLSPPVAPFSLLLTIAAPDTPGLAGLNYEEEAYLVIKALHEQMGVVVNEMGEVDDLLGGLRSDPPPLGVHFSGHGGPGTLIFENSTGGMDEVAAGELVRRIRQAAPDRLPRLFWLACCHGGDPPGLDGKGGLAATASVLHRDGIAQVVGYFGPVYDRLSTWAEAAFYREIAHGRRTRDAIRAARREMVRPLGGHAPALMRDAGAGRMGAQQVPFGWAQLVLYQRGPDYPLGQPIAAGAPRPEVRSTAREIVSAYAGSRTEVLRHGFVGRRKELHELRRRIDAGRPIHVVQGLGGLGKSALCGVALDLYRRKGWTPLPLWCFDVEGTPDPIGALYQQLQATVSALLGERAGNAFEIAQNALRQARTSESAAARIVYLIQATQTMLERPLAIYLDATGARCTLLAVLIGERSGDARESAAKFREETTKKTARRSTLQDEVCACQGITHDKAG